MAHEIAREVRLTAFGLEPGPTTVSSSSRRARGRFADGRTFDCPKCHGNLTLSVPPF